MVRFYKLPDGSKLTEEEYQEYLREQESGPSPSEETEKDED